MASYRKHNDLDFGPTVLKYGIQSQILSDDLNASLTCIALWKDTFISVTPKYLNESEIWAYTNAV